MNALVPTQARFTVAQIWALIEKGLLFEESRFELLDGEIIQMPPKGPLHEEARREVVRWLSVLIEQFDYLAETTLYLDEDTFLEPDYAMFSRSVKMADLKGSDIVLLIEVAKDSWDYDTTVKAQRYAEHGVQEYWVVNAASRIIRVHRGGDQTGWNDVRDMEAGEPVAPLCAPDHPFALR